MWLMYEATKNDKYRISAEQNEKFFDGAFGYWRNQVRALKKLAQT